MIELEDAANREIECWIGKASAMPIKKLKDHLDGEKIKYVTISHSPAFTAMEVAESAHVPGRALAKTVMVKLDGRMAMAVLPSTRKVALNLLRESVSAQEAKLASEAEWRSLFPDCDTGAMPPLAKF